ncbi:uncharacterized protein DFL_004118 [Arthrobotrys flagrans]|uniref:pH-response regulator protein palC n=1 Tax=Arthrobotrys flagrans TaxID=97331 RepID=A0A437A3T5_ARTFL|nr:hypothetical protein DFL_004118 [Arthrobotrys flagrans]
MTFAFTLPTTSPVNFTTSFASSSAPSLPSAATTRRALLRDTLKRYKRLTPTEQYNNLPSLLSSISEYLPYLYTLDAYITSQDITPLIEFETEWRAVLSRRTVPTELPRIRRKGLDYEICFATTTLAYVHTLRARTFLASAIRAPPPTDNNATNTSVHLINQAKDQILTAASIFLYLQNRSTTKERDSSQTMPADVTTSIYNALWSLCLASATLLAVLKDDPYPSIVALQHDKNSKEWMYKAPTVPTRVRSLLLARLCMYSADMAGKAAAGVAAAPGSGAELKGYCDDMAKTAKAKACRFQGIDAEGQGKVGEAIGWVLAGKEVLGMVVSGDGDKGKLGRGIDMLKKAREERKMEKVPMEALLGPDAGKTEEAMVLNELERRWRRINDSVNFHNVPSTSSLLARLPTGRPMFPENQTWTPPKLSSSELSQLQTQAPNGGELDWIGADDSDDDIMPAPESSMPPGGFPRSQSTGYY